MQFSTIVQRVKDITKVSGKDDLLKEGINAGLNWATQEDLPYLNTRGTIVTVAPVESGTVSVTKGSKTVTASGTQFTLLMADQQQKIRIGGDNTYYRIATFVSTSEITLDEEYLADTNTTASYKIYKDQYLLPPDTDNYKVFRQIANQESLGDIEATAFDIINPSPVSFGSPDFTILQGTMLETYEVGTVSATANTSIITGSSTLWATVEGLANGSIITVGTNTFTVKSVDTATQITVYETITAGIASSTAYIIHLDNIIVQFDQIPDTVELIRFKYQRIVFPLVADADIPDMPNNYHHILITAGKIWAWETKDRVYAQTQTVLFEAQAQRMWKRIGHISKSRNYPRVSQVRHLSFPLIHPKVDPRSGFPIRIG